MRVEPGHEGPRLLRGDCTVRVESASADDCGSARDPAAGIQSIRRGLQTGRQSPGHVWKIQQRAPIPGGGRCGQGIRADDQVKCLGLYHHGKIKG